MLIFDIPSGCEPDGRSPRSQGNLTLECGMTFSIAGKPAKEEAYATVRKVASLNNR